MLRCRQSASSALLRRHYADGHYYLPSALIRDTLRDVAITLLAATALRFRYDYAAERRHFC